MKHTGVPPAKPPSSHNWKTTDQDEIERRRYRAQTEQMRIRNLDPQHPVFSNFEVKSTSGLSYTVEIRSLSQKRFSCNCIDFRIKAQARRQQAGRKLKMARLLAAGGLLEEEREALLNSALWLAKAVAVEGHLQEPAELGESLRAPGSIFWGSAAAVLMKYAADASSPPGAVTEAIQNLLGGIPSWSKT
jgi:hypothetical protein